MATRTKTFKITVLGDGGVGKTSIRKRYLGEGFKASYGMTVGADFAVKRVNVDGENITLQIWDLAGQQRFSKVREVYYKGSIGAVLVFDITRPGTYQNLPSWLHECIVNNNNRRVPFILLGNKADLRDIYTTESVPEEQGVEYARILSEWSGYEIPYLETSALTGLNIDEAFIKLLRYIMKLFH